MTDLKNWNKPIFSWFGRVTILKMNTLPRLLYLLQTIPLHLPPAFKTYKSACSRFLWGDCKPRICYAHLNFLKHLGGIGLSDIRNYYRAWHLARILDWNVHGSLKDWVTLKASFTSLPLNSLPWLLDRHIPQEIHTHPMIGPMLKCFKTTCKTTSLSTTLGPLTPFQMNPDFPPGLHPQFSTEHWPDDQMLATHFFDKSRLLSNS